MYQNYPVGRSKPGSKSANSWRVANGWMICRADIPNLRRSLAMRTNMTSSRAAAYKSELQCTGLIWIMDLLRVYIFAQDNQVQTCFDWRVDGSIRLSMPSANFCRALTFQRTGHVCASYHVHPGDSHSSNVTSRKGVRKTRSCIIPEPGERIKLAFRIQTWCNWNVAAADRKGRI